jgi:hypothetical protein
VTKGGVGLARCLTTATGPANVGICVDLAVFLRISMAYAVIQNSVPRVMLSSSCLGYRTWFA